MASAITRNGKTYRTAHTFKFSSPEAGQIVGEVELHEGGEISESEVDSMIEADKADAELEQQERDFIKDDEEDAAAQLINLKSKRFKSKSKLNMKGSK